ncbi:MAG: Hsp70 family protein [Bacteroidales bacterium]
MAAYLIGVDLGTTNSALAFVHHTERLRGGRPTVRRFAIRQMVRPGEFEARDTLPSFLYFPTPEEREQDDAAPIVGVYARDRGALVPGRQVTSAKSWLCNAAVDRGAAILPWGHGEDDPGFSPIDASSRYLAHLRDSWNTEHPGEDDRFERQRIVLTVPASFDEEARELTLRAAREAGLEDVTLLEEPLAAFYAWIASHASSFRRHVRDNIRILVCDVGGGTTDFTLIGARTDESGDGVRFERTAVGEHLLLGGDNLDLALAHRVEAKLPNARLTIHQHQALARLTSAAKERLLTDRGVDRLSIAVPGAGRALVGGRVAADLTREEVLETLLTGFLPAVPPHDMPARGSRTGLREFGLPYATEPAITRHLAAFLTRAAATDDASVGAMVRPDAILFNGGFFVPEAARDAVVRTLESWFRGTDPAWRLEVLTNRNPATAVATGAAYYAFVRGHGGLRVSGGSARAYYVGLRADVNRAADGGATPSPIAAVCVMPRGTEEGTTLPLAGRLFTIATNRPVAFPLFSSTTRRDALGDVVTLEPGEVHEHAPLVTVLRYGKKSRQPDLAVRLSARFTEVGTLELWCESDVSDHRWRLQFELRATEQGAAQPEDEEQDEAAPDDGGAATTAVVEEAAPGRAAERIRRVFSLSAEAPGPESLVADIESDFGFARQAWPLALIRRLADVLLEVADGRKRAARYEARWLNLTGFCLRPGFGAALDEWRLDQLRRIYLAGLAFPRDLQNQAEWLVLWQRVAGGLTVGQQQELYQRHRAPLGVGGKKEAKRVNPQVEREGWRLLASLERLPSSNRASLGSQLLARIGKQPGNASLLWALGRLGARIPAYGPLDRVVPATAAAAWIDALLERDRHGSRQSDEAPIAAAVAQMAARTGDPHRDIDDGLRARVLAYLESVGAPADDLMRVREYLPPALSDGLRLFGETMPDGLRLVHEG